MSERARLLRRKQTPPEAIVWKRLRNRRLAGYKFKRQVPLGRYIADFLCAEKKLVVEIDGRSHHESTERDRARDAWMRENGLRVVRVTASDVSTNITLVLERILHALESEIA